MTFELMNERPCICEGSREGAYVVNKHNAIMVKMSKHSIRVVGHFMHVREKSCGRH